MTIIPGFDPECGPFFLWWNNCPSGWKFQLKWMVLMWFQRSVFHSEKWKNVLDEKSLISLLLKGNKIIIMIHLVAHTVSFMIMDSIAKQDNSTINKTSFASQMQMVCFPLKHDKNSFSFFIVLVQWCKFFVTSGSKYCSQYPVAANCNERKRKLRTIGLLAKVKIGNIFNP